MVKRINKLILLGLLLIAINSSISFVVAIDNGVFVQGVDMYNVDFKELKKNNITEIYLYSGAIMKYGHNKVATWIIQAHKEGFKVNIVVPVFQEQGQWHNLANQQFVDKKLHEIESYLELGADGINLDYIRYSGDAYKYPGADSLITSFVKKVHEKTKPKNIKLSLCIMPEPSNGIKYYGQNIKKLSKNCEELSVMIYKGNYKKNSQWILDTTKWYVTNSYCSVKPILQTYRSDNNLNVLSDHELSQDSHSCFNGGAKEVSYFQLKYLKTFPIDKYKDNNDIIDQNQDSNNISNESDDILDLDNISKSIEQIF